MEKITVTIGIFKSDSKRPLCITFEYDASEWTEFDARRSSVNMIGSMGFSGKGVIGVVSEKAKG